jgi:signal transduction histidine kinase
VTDTAVGLTRADQERVFERFYRAPNPMQANEEGFGIGLSIARALAQAQGGHLWAESPNSTDTCAGRGCKFTLLLPAIPSQAIMPGNAFLSPWMEETVPCQDEWR